MSVPTYVACLTPAGTAAIATIALQGPQAWELVQPLFKPRGHDRPDPAKQGRFWLGRLGDENGDEVVLTVQGDGSSQCIEIHCHGGAAVVRWLLGLFRERGAEEISWEEWLRRTAPSRLQAEAAIALAHAPTLRTANILLDQHGGALEREVREILRVIEEEPSSPLTKGGLQGGLSPGDNPPCIPPFVRGGRDVEGTMSAASAKLQALQQWSSLGRHLTQPWRVVLAGAPNVGKSSLINAILGYQRSIISPLPGTTRDVVTALTAIDGWPVELIDTAGLHDRAGGLEAEGIERAQQARTSADLCLWIVEAGQTPVFPAASAAFRSPLLPVINKMDLPLHWRLSESPWRALDVCRVSALTGEGIPALIEAMARRLVPQVPPPGAGVPFSEAICARVASAANALQAGDGSRARAILAELVGY